MKRLVWGLLVLLAIPAWAGLARVDWRVTRDVLLPPLSRPGDVYLPLDGPALAVDSLTEYRLVSDAKTEVPYRMVLEEGTTEERAVPAEAVRWTTQPDAAGQTKSLLAVLDLGVARLPVNRVEVGLTGEEVRAHVQVQESTSPGAPGTLLYAGDVFRSGPLLKTEVTLPTPRLRYLRFSFVRVEGPTLKIGGLSLKYVLHTPRRLDWVPLRLTRTEDAKHRRTVLDLDLGRIARDLVVLDLAVSEPAFDRQAWLEASDDTTRDRPQYDMVAIVNLRRERPGAAVAIAQHLAHARRLRLTIDNGDDAPLTLGKVTLWRLRRGLLFSADPAHTYQLWYGNPKAVQPSYEIQRLPLRVPPAKLPVAGLGEQKVLPPPSPPPPPWSEAHPALFWASLAVVVGLLGTIILKALRNARPAPTE